MGLEVNLFGMVRIRAHSQEISRLPKKARALLAYLASRVGEPVARDRLGDLLWPERESRLALQGVRNALFSLNQSLGQSADCIHATVQSVTLNEAVTDVGRFCCLADSEQTVDLETATALYRNELLSDLSSIETEPFQQWLEGERQRLEALFATVLRRLTAKYQALKDHAAAIRTARCLVALDPLSEADQRLLLNAYVGGGRRAEALRHYHDLVSLLSDELQVAPDPETAIIGQALMRPAEQRALTFPRTDVVGGPTPQWPLLRPNIVVGFVPIKGFGGSVDSLSSLNDDLITDLVEHGHGVSFGVADPRLPRDRESGFDYLITGAVHMIDGAHHLNIQIIHGRFGKYCWARRYPLSRNTAATKAIASDVHFSLLRAAGRRHAPLTVDGINGYLEKAAIAFGQRTTLDGTREAQRQLLQVLALEPSQVEALTGLARTCQHIVSQPGWADEETLATAIAIGSKAAVDALSYAPDHAPAHMFLGMLKSAVGELGDAAREFQQAIDADPQLAAAHAFAGYNETLMGRAERALPVIDRAWRYGWRNRQPAVPWFFAGFANLLLGRKTAAIDALRKSLEANPEFGSALVFLAAALRLDGKAAEAETIYHRLCEQVPYYQFDRFEGQWVSRSSVLAYQRQIAPVADAFKAISAEIGV